MSSSAARFHLVLDALVEPGGPRATAAGAPAPDTLEVPEGVSFLVPGSGERPVLGAGPAPRGAFAIEPVWDAAHPRLLLVGPPGSTAVVNGQPAPRVVLLDLRDQVAFARSPYVFHVTRYHPPCVGPAPEALAGRKCPICLERFTAGEPVYVCWNCRAAVHFAEPDPAAELHPAPGRQTPREHLPPASREELDCIQRCVTCPSCDLEIALSEGFSYLPEA